MIDVKGTKTKATEADASQRFVLKCMDTASNTPIYVGLFVAGLALYLRSFFPSWAQPKAAGGLPVDQGESNAAVSPEILADQEATEGPSKAQQEPGTINTSSTHELFPAAPFRLIESPPFQFKPPSLAPKWDPLKSSPLMPTPTNDNGGRSASADPGGGVSAGGGAATVRSVQSQDTRTGDAHDEDNGDGTSRSEDGDNDPIDSDGDEENTSTGNRAPRVAAPVYLIDVVGCATLLIALSDLLRNAHDADGDVLSVKNLAASSGTLTRSGNDWIFEGSTLGPVTISYEVTDGELTVMQTAHFSVVEQPPIIGTVGDDLLLGSMCADSIDGLEGHDNIDARTGDDLVAGGDGDDNIVAGAGNDRITGGAGSDVVFGGDGDDHISGGDGSDKLFGEAGDDVLFGDGDDDYLNGGAGADLLFGGAGDDVAYGDSGHDVIEGGSGNDELFGAGGDDVIHGGDGDDVIEGGEGNDTILDGRGSDKVEGGEGDDVVTAALDQENDTLDGGAGHDTLDYSHATSDLHLDMKTGSATGIEVGSDSISGFKHVIGGHGDDWMVAGNEPVVLAGGAGQNTFEFGSSTLPQDSLLIHEILDFKAGDRIKMSKYDIFEEVFEDLEDQFEKIYGDRVDEDDAVIRYGYDQREKIDRTLIEADLNNDGVFEITIDLEGHHVLVMVESA